MDVCHFFLRVVDSLTSSATKMQYWAHVRNMWRLNGFVDSGGESGQVWGARKVGR